MKKRVLIPLVFLAIMAMVIFVSQHSIQAQAPGGPGGPGGAGGAGGANRAMMMQMFSPDNQWAYISFELEGVTDEMLKNCRPAFKDAHTKSLAMRTKMGEANGDTDKMRALKTESDSIKSTLDAKLKTVLTPAQIAKIAAWEKETRARMQQRAGGGPGGAGGTQQRRGN
jgi:Spy/CpxP family protein refolding chaperone